MTGYLYIACLAATLLSLGCEASPNGRGTLNEGNGRGSRPTHPVIDGYYVFGHEVNTFRPCARDSTYWVVGNGRTMDSLRAAYIEWSSENQAEPYEPMFARFRGHSSADKLDGFAEAYGGLFSVEDIVLLRGIEEDDCRPDD